MPKTPDEKVRWRHIENYFRNLEGYHIYPNGNSRIIAGPIVPPKKMRPSVVIRDANSFTKNSEILEVFLNQIEAIFGVTRDDILNNANR